MTAAMAVHRAYTQAGSLILVVCPCLRQSGEFLRKAETFVSRLGIRVHGDGYNDLSILLPNGSRIVGLPQEESNTRGFSNVSLLLIDEASRVPDNVYKALRPTLIASDGDLWLMSTPNGKRGFYYQEWNEGKGWKRITVKATECLRIKPHILEEERAALGENWFRQEYLCEFLDREGALFRQEDIDACYDDFEPLNL